ncbi:flagellar basal-body MS-ring/collar protein FliF [Gluconobacter sp. OJB]|uniref:flagellar basal-body MS-ring/collar protein FliF n=1 Tax=Gluconobacter sp. OJB TaxID=3145196 RepID=UPI0031F84539
MKALLENLKQLGLPRLAALGGVGVSMLVLLGVLVLHGVNATNGLLYRDLEPHEAGEIVDQLAKAHIKYRLQDQGSTIMVPDDDVARARLLLAKDGLPSGGAVGYEIFDKGNSFTATQFEQTINETRALEGELERSIRLIHGVQNARVHLVLRHRELFSTAEQNAQASVLLSMDGGRRLDEENVAAIVNLVAAAVPGLDAHNISLIDNRGHVLLKQGEGNANGDQSLEGQRQIIEQRIAHEVEDLLGASLGPGHVRVEANVTMNNDHIRETQESYDPDQQVLRSQQTKTEKNINTQGPANTTVSNNLPNANAGQQQNGSQSNRQEQTNNYEIGKTVRTLIQDQPRIARISMAVMVDGISQSDEKGKFSWQPRNEEELARLTALTKSAVGFDQRRGDIVTVMSMKFTDIGTEMRPEISNWRKFFDRRNEMEAVKFGLFVFCLAMVLFFVVRPLLKPIGDNSHKNLFNTLNSVSESQTITAPSRNAIYLSDNHSEKQKIQILEAPEDSLDLANEETVFVNGVQGRIKASSVQKVIDLVGAHPSESISLLRGWLVPGQGGVSR